MNIQLINTPNKNFSTIQQILHNRGFCLTEINHYLKLSKSDLNSPLAFGEEKLKLGVNALIRTIQNNDRAIVVVDCDCDGYTSAALLINYLHYLFPTWVENKLEWIMHESKAHGLNEHLEYLLTEDFKLIISPDGGSNDYEAHKKLKEKNKTVLVLDHHLAEKISSDAIIINNQTSNYPNKQLAGVGVVWQFCRYIDSLLNKDYSILLIDLVALGLVGDMMSLTSFETKFLIMEGFKKENIKNPFIEYMLDKNSFPLNKTEYKSAIYTQACTGMGAAFYIVPFVNATTRSGTLEEKNLIFSSMLNYKAFTKVPEVKRGKDTGREEYLVLKATRAIGNIKNRQSKAETEGLLLLEKIIKEKQLLQEHKILLLLIKEGQISPEIRGLIANKLASKYQRPCAILTQSSENTYEGSMRGYTKTGIQSFKKVLENCPGVLYVRGHDNAAGLGLKGDEINNFLTHIDNSLKNISTELVYRVDYLFKESEDNSQKIYDIASMNDFWGQDIERSYVAIKFKVTNENFKIMKSNTLKIVLKNNLSLIKFKGTEEDIEAFTTEGWKEILAVCQCNVNSWNGIDYPQLLIEDYEIIDSCKYFF